MNTIIKFSFLILSIFIISCSDPCKDVDCGANGSCDEGICVCAEGYEGASCETEIRGKFLGTYEGSLAGCLEALPIPDAIPAELLTIQAVSSGDPSNINQVVLNTPNPLLMLEGISFDPNAGIFIIPTSTQALDIPNIPLPVSITANGNGQFIDENTLEISLSITFSVPLIPAIACTITMNKV